MLNIDHGIEPDALSDFPGGPFSQAAIDAAVASIRTECWWHIAPIGVETKLFRTDRSPVLLLPTMRAVEVTSVVHRPTRYESALAVVDWDFLSDAGVMERYAGWPMHVEVSFRHGLDKWPADLLALIADRARTVGVGGRVRQESLLGRSVSLDYGSVGAVSDPVIAAYRLQGAP